MTVHRVQSKIHKDMFFLLWQGEVDWPAQSPYLILIHHLQDELEWDRLYCPASAADLTDTSVPQQE